MFYLKCSQGFIYWQIYCFCKENVMTMPALLRLNIIYIDSFKCGFSPCLRKALAHIYGPYENGEIRT